MSQENRKSSLLPEILRWWSAYVLLKPRVRLVGIAAVELLVIDGLDLFTVLSTMP